MPLLTAPLLVALLLSYTPQPPKKRFDAKRNVTVYSSGDVRTGERDGMAAEFEFSGKEPMRPKSVRWGIGSLRVSDQDQPPPDSQLLRWKDVSQITLSFSGKTLRLPAKEGWQVSRNGMVVLLYGHALEEHVDVDLSPDQFIEIAESPTIAIVIGRDRRVLQGKALSALRKLAASIPP